MLYKATRKLELERGRVPATIDVLQLQQEHKIGMLHKATINGSHI